MWEQDLGGSCSGVWQAINKRDEQLSQLISLGSTYKEMSSNELYTRKSRFSDRDYENSSLCNRSIKSDLNSLSVELPHKRKKQNSIEREIVQRQPKNMNITINLTNTKYPIIQEVCTCDELNWKTQNFGESRNWSIKWCDTGVTNEMLQKMHYLQRINHFPGMGVIARKNTLALTLARMKESFPKQFDFFPRTFLYPQDSAKIRHYFIESRRRGLLKTFIVKPQAGCQGRGIYLCQNPADFEKQQRCVVQKYVSNPLLFKGLKFDFRIYVLVACIEPLRIYLYNQGLVRFSTEQYQLPDPSNLDNFYMHLTNYAINKSHPGYEYNNSINNMSHGHKKSLAEFFRILKEKGYKANHYWGEIKDNIIKTVIAAQPYLLSNYKSSRSQEPTSNMCFQLLGFDFMIDNQDRCYLLEVNHTPSFSVDTPLDHIIKKNLIKDTLLMMAVSPEEMQARDQLQRLKQKDKYAKFKNGKDNTDKEKQFLIETINEIREKQEQAYCGTYEKIFPSKHDNKQLKYMQLLSSAAKIHQTSSTATTLSSMNIRSRLKQLPSSKIAPKQMLAKVNEKVETTNRKNIIYNYNNVRHNAPTSKKALQTLPAESIRNDLYPRKQMSSGLTGQSSHSKIKTEPSVSREGEKPQLLRSLNKIDEKKYNMIALEHLKSNKKAKSSYASQQKQHHKSHESSSFSKRIKAYRTPF